MNGGDLGTEAAAEEALRGHCSDCGYGSGLDSDCDDIAAINSAQFSIGLGTGDFGRRPYVLAVHERELTARSYTRASLRPPRRGVEIGYGPARSARLTTTTDKPEQVIEWVKSATRFTKLNDIEGGYEVRQYTLDQVDEAHQVSGEPFSVTKVYNPDHPIIHSRNRRLILEKNTEGRASLHEYRYHRDASRGRVRWELYEGEPGSHLTRPLRLRRLEIDDPQAAERGDYTKTWTTYHWDAAAGQLHLDEKKRETFRRFKFGERMIQRVLDPDGKALTVTLDYYGYEAGGFPITGRVKHIQLADGGWEYYVYDEMGRQRKSYRPSGSRPLPKGEPINGPGVELLEVEYDGPGYQERRSYYRDGHLVKRGYRQWEVDDLEKDREVVFIEAARGEAAVTDPSNRIERRTYRANDRRLIRTTFPDGSSTEYGYELVGATLVTTEVNRPPNQELLSTARTITHPGGAELDRLLIDGPSGIVTEHVTVPPGGLDARFRPVTTLDHVTQEISTRSYSCCGLEWKSDGRGFTIRNEYDALGRPVRRQHGYKSPTDPGNTFDVILSDEAYHLSGSDKTLSTTNLLQGEHPLRPTARIFDLAGHVIETTDASGVVTRTKTIFLDDGGRIELTSLPKSGIDQRHRITQKRYETNGKLRRERSYAAKDPFATVNLSERHRVSALVLPGGRLPDD